MLLDAAVAIADNLRRNRAALKVLPAEPARTPAIRARFLQEGETTVRRRHPNVIATYGRGETENDQLWTAMQYVKGTDVEAALQAGAMTPYRAQRANAITIDDFMAFDVAPFSIVAQHMEYLQQVRVSFVAGAYLPSLTASGALGERILNELMISTRDDFPQSAVLARSAAGVATYHRFIHLTIDLWIGDASRAREHRHYDAGHQSRLI